MDALQRTHPPLTTDVVQTGRLARRGQALVPRIGRTVVSTLQGLGAVIGHAFHHRDTIQYPDEMVYLPPRYRGRIVLSRDPAGEERCVACYLCAVVCPVDCIALQATEDDSGRDVSSAVSARTPVPPTPSSSRPTWRCASTSGPTWSTRRTTC
jgi:ferredoxin